MSNKYNYTQMELPLLETLNEFGGKAKTSDVYEALAEKLNIPVEARNEKIDDNSSHKRWSRMVRWVRQNLKMEGYITGDNKGVWELTEKAKSFLLNSKPGVLIRVYEYIDENNNTQGIAIWGEAQAAHGVIENGSLDLIITSPPYPLVTEKQYGNKPEKEYINWFMPIAEKMYNSLSDTGSLILNLGPTFLQGIPVQSYYIHKLVVSLCEDLGFYLAQEHYAHNEGKLPTSCWVTVERIRITNAIENVLWLSKTPYPKANNRNVLVPYSESYKKVLEKGGYPAYMRPSGHLVDRFNRNNGGKIPHNLIKANTASNDRYIRYCKANNIQIHPARMSPDLAEFYINLTTDPKDIVADFFAGSNVVGEKCIELDRRFIVIEKSLTYLKGSVGRFDTENLKIYEPLLSA